MASVLGASLVQSWVGYANSLLFWSPVRNLCRLKRIQTSLARVILTSQLHWLPVEKRVEFKLLTSLTFKTLSVGQPAYLRSKLIHDCLWTCVFTSFFPLAPASFITGTNHQQVCFLSENDVLCVTVFCFSAGWRRIESWSMRRLWAWLLWWCSKTWFDRTLRSLRRSRFNIYTVKCSINAA